MEEDGMQALGFMFDSEHEKACLQYDFQDGYSVRIKTIGENPGHKQSGQYVWPASKGLAEYLLDNRENESISHAARIVELGSGCGIGGIIAAKALSGCNELILTDYDPGALSLIDDNIGLNHVEGKCKTSFLEWGQLDSTEGQPLIGTIDLVIGADLIYSKDVVLPLFQTIKACLHPASTAFFLLVTSFALGDVREYLFILYSFLCF